MKNYILVFCSTLLFSFNSFAQIDVSGGQAARLWSRIESIGKNENVQVVQTENNQQVIHLGRVSCVFEMYNACSIFVNIGTDKKMIVALDGTAEFMNQLAAAGVWVDEERAQIGVNGIDCITDENQTRCKLDTYENTL
jgi:hypothetical protein